MAVNVVPRSVHPRNGPVEVVKGSSSPHNVVKATTDARWRRCVIRVAAPATWYRDGLEYSTVTELMRIPWQS